MQNTNSKGKGKGKGKGKSKAESKDKDTWKYCSTTDKRADKADRYICNPFSGYWVVKDKQTGKKLIHRFGEEFMSEYSRSVASESKPELCLRGYQIKDVLGTGSVGVIHSACLKDKCNYAVKLQLLNDVGIEEFIKELEISKTLHKKGVGPKFHGGWTCPPFGVLVTDQWDGHLEDSELSTMPKKLIQKLEDQIQKMHDSGYVHFDIMPKNVLVKRSKQSGEIIDLTLTDWGISEKISNLPELTDAWIERLYDYHKYHLISEDYIKDKEIIFEDVRKNPLLLDNTLIYFLKKCSCRSAYKCPT